MHKYSSASGFTLIELLVVIGIIAILAASVIVAVNPARQFAQSRDARRRLDVIAILDAVHQNAIDHKGVFSCTAASPIPAALTYISSADYDICDCIMPDYVSLIPIDPSAGEGNGTCPTVPGQTYNTGYQIKQDAASKRITVTAPATEIATSNIEAIR